MNRIVEGVEIVRCRRKTAMIRVSRDLRVTARVPLQASEQEVIRFILENKVWISRQQKKMQEKNCRLRMEGYSEEEIHELKKLTEFKIHSRLPFFTEQLNLQPKRVKITRARTRWGSCSGRNSICFSMYLGLLPDELIDYVIVHELVHVRIKNHSHTFYHQIEKILPDYKERIQLLKQY